MSERQGLGEIRTGRGARLLDLLASRDGVPTTVRLVTGEELLVHNIAWGRDLGDLWEHVTTNCSPFIEGQPIDLFLTSHVVTVTDPATGRTLYEQEPRPDET